MHNYSHARSWVDSFLVAVLAITRGTPIERGIVYLPKSDLGCGSLRIAGWKVETGRRLFGLNKPTFSGLIEYLTRQAEVDITGDTNPAVQ